MRALGGRPILMERYPEGAGGPSFFQKRVPKNAPDWLETTTVADAQRHAVAGARRRGRGPHRVGGQPRLPRASRVAVPGRRPRALRRASDRRRPVAGRHLRHGAGGRPRGPRAPDELGLSGAPKTTGRNGIHIYVRLLPEQDSFAVRAAAVALARELERRRPDLITAAWWKEERGTRVFIDFNQNAPHKTVLGAWSVRPRVGGQVSTPLAWDELDSVVPDELTLATVPGPGRRERRSVGGNDRVAPVARAAARAPPARHGRRDDGRPVAAGLPEDAERAGPRRAEPGAQDGGMTASDDLVIRTDGLDEALRHHAGA